MHVSPSYCNMCPQKMGIKYHATKIVGEKTLIYLIKIHIHLSVQRMTYMVFKGQYIFDIILKAHISLVLCGERILRTSWC